MGDLVGSFIYLLYRYIYHDCLTLKKTRYKKSNETDETICMICFEIKNETNCLKMYRFFDELIYGSNI